MLASYKLYIFQFIIRFDSCLRNTSSYSQFDSGFDNNSGNYSGGGEVVSDLMDIYNSGIQLNKNTNMNVVSPANMQRQIYHPRVQRNKNMSTMIPPPGVNHNMQPQIYSGSVEPEKNNTIMSATIPNHGVNRNMHRQIYTASVQQNKNTIMSTMVPTPSVNQNLHPQVYISSVHEHQRSNTMMNTSTMGTSIPVMNMVATPGFNQNMQHQMDQNLYGQQGGANSYYHYKMPNAEVATVPMQANASTTTFDSSFDHLKVFNSQSDVDAYNNAAFIDSPTVASSSYDLSMFYQKGNQ